MTAFWAEQGAVDVRSLLAAGEPHDHVTKRGVAVKSSDLVTVSTFRSMADAQIAKGVLDEAGIDSMIRADNAGGMYPAIGGAELLVRSEDVEKASEALQRRDAST